MDFSCEIKVTKGQLRDMPVKMRERIVPTAIQRLANMTYYEMRNRAPVRSGNLRAMISEKVSKTNFEVASTVPYTPFVVLGTRAHVIRPVEAGVLHWVTDQGADVFAMRVFHPGTRPNDFITATACVINPQVVDVFERVFNEEVDRY